MEQEDAVQIVMWREGPYRCEVWGTNGKRELRVFVSDVLTYRERVRDDTGEFQQAAQLLANAQASIFPRFSA